MAGVGHEWNGIFVSRSPTNWQQACQRMYLAATALEPIGWRPATSVMQHTVLRHLIILQTIRHVTLTLPAATATATATATVAEQQQQQQQQ
jgi:hypothetical protein